MVTNCLGHSNRTSQAHNEQQALGFKKKYVKTRTSTMGLQMKHAAVPSQCEFTTTGRYLDLVWKTNITTPWVANLSVCILLWVHTNEWFCWVKVTAKYVRCTKKSSVASWIHARCLTFLQQSVAKRLKYHNYRWCSLADSVPHCNWLAQWCHHLVPVW